jgi:hypothetical protein
MLNSISNTRLLIIGWTSIAASVGSGYLYAKNRLAQEQQELKRKADSTSISL